MRVHISAHPADRYLYLEAVLRVLETIDGCSVSYTDAPSDTRQDLPKDADTLVVLATERYFTWQNSGYESECLAAKSRGIRIIPVMLQGHIVDLVNMRCSKTQYIDASENFDFALDALRAHLLNPVPRVVDESLPSVFISYRRQEKEALKALLAVLEKAPNYSSFNLWYDEIIAPGDNYSYSIMKALEKSDLFILLVTPSILEGYNYVMRAESPTAKKQGKKIVAVEAIKTDRVLLNEKYPDLPKCISIKQAGALYARLQVMRDKC